jgi:Helix-turn-helix
MGTVAGSTRRHQPPPEGSWPARAMIRISSAQLRYQVAIRGWSQEMIAHQAGISIATVSRAMRGMPVRGPTALRLVQALRRQPPLPELIDLVDGEST